MRKATFGLAALVVPAIIGAVLAGGCKEAQDAAGDAAGATEDLCGPCGLVATGDIGISGNARIDGFFKAVADLNSAALKVQAGFLADLAALEAAFDVDVEADADIGARVDALILKIQGEIEANVDGGLAIQYAPPKCSANVSVAVEAQASCEAKADCEVEVDPGNIKVECSGTCSGSCSGTCSGDFSCKVKAPSVECSGKCEGSCELEAAAACEGTCHGQCDGTCSAMVTNAEGETECNGECDGDCSGSCELSAAAECSGTCTGSCLTTPGSAGCDAKAECNGSCEGECSGGCEGEATPPSASAKCDASADCKAQAKAQASANVECTPPSLEIGFEFNADAQADVDAQAQFRGEIEALKVHGVAMLQGIARYQALFTGEVNGEVVFDPSPIASLTSEIKGMAKASAKGDIFAGIPTLRITCALDAFVDAGKMLVDLSSEAKANLEAQATFAGAVTGGFKS
jgi:hypothetical protein